MEGRIKLTVTETAKFLAHVRKMFPATDELAVHLTRSALERISTFDWPTVEAAIVSHGIQYGGRGRAFIVGAFLERLGERSDAARRETDRLRALARREEEVALLDGERRRIEQERAAMREAILEADATDVDQAIGYLRSLGWTVPPWPTAVPDWSPFLVIAVHDLLTDHDWPDVAHPGSTLSARDALARVPVRRMEEFGVRSGPK